MRLALLAVATACQNVPVAVLTDIIASSACLPSIKMGYAIHKKWYASARTVTNCAGAA